MFKRPELLASLNLTAANIPKAPIKLTIRVIIVKVILRTPCLTLLYAFREKGIPDSNKRNKNRPQRIRELLIPVDIFVKN
tara:strand:+ start:42 stop:281 length:240 start_codon:yes stop_codon:yes gene_type:complete